MDNAIGGLMQEFDETGLTDKVNILIASDHGMTDVSDENTINLGSIIDFNEEIEWSYTSAVGLIIPKDGKLTQVQLGSVTKYHAIFYKFK